MLIPTGRQNFFQRGTVFHKGLECFYKGSPITRAQQEFGKLGEDDRVKLWCMLKGYEAFWLPQDRESFIPTSIEEKFDIPLRHPETMEIVEGVRLRGAIDLIARDKSDGRSLVLEHKTTSEGIGTGASYWKTLKLSPQAMLYYLAAREQGWKPKSVVYNVARVPTLRRKKTESKDEYRNRIMEDMIKAPTKYFARQGFSFSEDKLKRFMFDIYHTWTVMDAMSKAKATPRYTSNCKMGNWVCEYLDICTGDSSRDEKDRWRINDYHKIGSGDTPEVQGELRI